MFDSLLNSIGLSQSANTGLYNYPTAQNTTGIVNNATQNHQLAAGLAYNQAIMAASLNQNRHQWMIDGRTMTWREWLDELAPGDDNPLRTFLTLKYQK